MELVIIVGGILLTFGYIFLSSPGDKLRKKHSLFRTSLKSNCKEDEEVFEYLKENDIKPCFLQKDLEEHVNDNSTQIRSESFSSGVRKTPLTNHQSQMIILNSYNNCNIQNDNDFSMKLRRK